MASSAIHYVSVITLLFLAFWMSVVSEVTREVSSEAFSRDVVIL